MARAARGKSPSGLYHVLVEGKELFASKEEMRHYLFLLSDCRFLKKSGEEKARVVFLYGYVLFKDHGHMLLEEAEEGGLGRYMRRVNSRYAAFIAKGGRRALEHGGASASCPLFYDRYRSQLLSGEEALVAFLQYLHFEPVKRGECRTSLSYEFSSLRAYERLDPSIDYRRVLDASHYRGGLYLLAAEEAREPDILESRLGAHSPTDEEALRAMESIAGAPLARLKEMEKEERNHYLRVFRRELGLSIRQISRLSGIGRGIVQEQ